jgi:hypothetical protein
MDGSYQVSHRDRRTSAMSAMLTKLTGSLKPVSVPPLVGNLPDAFVLKPALQSGG